jgi:peptide subunit release factor 1 (eRF1)
MNFSVRLAELSKITGAPAPVVSVYLNTRWVDEHQRGRVRVFLKNELRKARQSAAGRVSGADLDWIQAEGEALISQARTPDAHGVALFACEALGLREVLLVRVPFEDSFVVSDAPALRPLAALLEDAPTTLVVFVDAERARLIPLTPAGAEEELTLENEPPPHPRSEGWPARAYSHYRKHILDMRRPHFEAVAESLTQLADGHGARRIVLAGEPRNVAGLTKVLPSRLAARIVGTVAGARFDTAAALVGRAAELISQLEGQRAAEEVDAVITESAKGGHAVAGVDVTVEALNRGAVHRLYLTNRFAESGRVCGGCGALQRGAGAMCRLCGQPTRAVDLADAMADRALAAGGTVQMVEIHQALTHFGGVAARLRYPL